MTKICSKCGSSLAADVRFCPQCGTATSSYYSNSSPASPYDPTAASLRSSAPQHKPPTDYGSPPYGVPPQNPYEPLNPYEAPLRPPPPPPPSPIPVAPPTTRGNTFPQALASPRNILLLALVILVLLVGVIVAVGLHQISSQANADATATAVTSMNQMTATASAATPTAQANATATAVTNPYGGGGTLSLTDPLRDNSLGNGWFEGSLPVALGSGSCTFTARAYHATNPSNGKSAAACASTRDFSNFAFEVQMTILKGDAGGIQIRTDAATLGNGYEILIAPNGQCIVVRQDKSNPTVLVDWKSNSAIHQGLGQTNLVAVVANGTTLTFYVNHQQVASVTDTMYTHGVLALVSNAYPTGGQLTEAAFSNAKVWAF